MSRALPILCLAGAALAWGLALWAPKAPPPLPERFRGRFLFADFEQPEGLVAKDPRALNQTHHITFREDGSYLWSVVVSGGHELLRREGVVSVDERGILTLAQVSLNRREAPEPPQHFAADWGKDETGPFLVLRHVAGGFAYVLRPEAEGEAPGR